MARPLLELATEKMHIAVAQRIGNLQHAQFGFKCQLPCTLYTRLHHEVPGDMLVTARKRRLN
jgi:hypothetical protein